MRALVAPAAGCSAGRRGAGGRHGLPLAGIVRWTYALGGGGSGAVARDGGRRTTGPATRDATGGAARSSVCGAAVRAAGAHGAID